MTEPDALLSRFEKIGKIADALGVDRSDVDPTGDGYVTVTFYEPDLDRLLAKLDSEASR